MNAAEFVRLRLDHQRAALGLRLDRLEHDADAAARRLVDRAGAWGLRLVTRKLTWKRTTVVSSTDHVIETIRGKMGAS